MLAKERNGDNIKIRIAIVEAKQNILLLLNGLILTAILGGTL